MGKRINSMRDVIESFKEEFIIIDKEVDPIYEIAGIQKALEGSSPLLFNNIKGYPEARCIGNVFSEPNKLSKIFGLDDPKKLKFKCLEAMRHPIQPKIISDAPCQEVVITDNIDVMRMMPIIKHTPRDGARILGGGNYLIGGKDFKGGMDLSFKRTHFRGKDWATVWIGPGSHTEKLITTELRGKRLDLTLNITTPPAVNLVAAACFLHSIIPAGENEVAFAGGLQGEPVDIVKAKTVDAYAIANAEWVIEGYIDTSKKVWETDEAEQIGEVKRRGMGPPFFPEWQGYLGRAIRSFKLQVTAITHRKERPILFTPLARSLEHDHITTPFREACFYELAERIAPGFVADVHVIPGIAAHRSHVVLQVKKRRPRDEGIQKEIIGAFLASDPILQLVIAVDEDVNIYSVHDLLWAIITRCDAEKGMIKSPIVRGLVYEGVYPSNIGIGFDATIPWGDKDLFERAHYPSDTIDLRKWIPEEKIAAAQILQSEYARILAKTGH
jgi:4-hydroxy-3-polyprenylbenzoate decarboxylase